MSKPWERLLAGGLIGGLSVALAVGCSSDHSAAEGRTLERLFDPSQVIGADVVNEFPVGQEWRHKVEWGAPADYYRTGFELYQASIDACMTERGFTYAPAPWFDDDLMSIVVNPLNREAALAYGYHLPPYGATGESTQADDSAEFLAALGGDTGLDERGCSDIAFDFAYAGPASDDAARQFDQVVQAISTAISGYASTSEGMALIDDWSECMDKEGFDYEAPGGPQEEFSDDATVGEKELRVRRADLECDAEVGLTSSRSAYEAALFQTWLDDHSDAVDDYATSLALAKAEITSRQAELDRDGTNALPP